jgi:phage protein D
VPAFEVKVGGNDVDMETRRDIIEVKYQDSIDQFDSFEITINNWDEERLDFKYTGPRTGQPEDEGRDELFDPGQEIELWMGYFRPLSDEERATEDPEPLRLMLAGIITSLSPIFPASGQPTLKISGKNALMKMITRQETHTYREQMRDSEIAEAVGRRGSLTLGNMRIPLRTNEEAKGREAPHPEQVLQNNQYDILFLIQLAHQNGYDVVLKQESRNGQPEQFLYFGPSTDDPPVSYLLEWGKSLVSFEPTLTTARQVNELTVRGWDSQRREAINVTVRRSDLPTRGLRDEDRLRRIEQGFQARHEIIVDRPFRNRQEARRYALDRLERLSKDLVTARSSTFGTPDLRAGRKIEISNLGRTFDGQYFIKSTTHTIGAGGYTTSFEARLEEEN